jgi:hypothetical protein
MLPRAPLLALPAAAPHPAQPPRLEQICNNLSARIAEAEATRWLGEAEGPVGGGHTAAGHDLVTGVLAGSVSPLGSSRRTPIRDAPGRSRGQGSRSP